MADMLTFSRDTMMTVNVNNIIWEIPILSGFSFSQQQDVSEITLNEASAANGTARRGRNMQINALQPAEFSFQTYIRPFDSKGTNVTGNAEKNGDAFNHVVEEVLWSLLTQDSGGTYTQTSDSADSAVAGFTQAAAATTLAGFGSKNTLNTCKIQFIMNSNNSSNDIVYELRNAVINECTIDFDIEGIATATWSGFAQTLTEEASTPDDKTVYEGVNATNNFIRNRLSSATITAASLSSTQAFELAITGGSWTYSNNITFLTPDELGKVNKPTVHVAGHRSVSGSFTCYLNADIGTAGVNANLFELIAEAGVTGTADTSANKFIVDLFIGGKASTEVPLSPGLYIDMEQCHLAIPTHSMDDLVSLEITYDALPSTIAGVDEITKMVFTGPTPNVDPS
tara:strand:- start:47 stop:1237 length:1191 start_codon:yes stop_codon:yes gene_type:complete